MGGGYYSQDVAHASRSNNQDVFSYQGYGPSVDAAAGRRSVHQDLDPKGRTRECLNTTPIVVALDVTRSRGDDSRIIYDKLPMFIGQIEMKGYVEGAAISFAAIGDAAAGDSAPLQVGQFEADNRLDDVLSKFWLEEGGGGTGQESYELAAYFYARNTRLKAHKEGRKGYFFFVGDEGFYPQVDRMLAQRVLGAEIAEDIDSAQIFRELQERFHVFLIFPQQSFEERKDDIDAEIKQRVQAAGGQYDNVDIRASLIWNNRNDLDLHIVPPSGEVIYYGHKRSACEGWLDVDRNVQGETSKPVENTRWSKGTAPAGHYQVLVQNYGFHEPYHSPTDFRVEVEINGEIRHFDGKVSTKGETGPRSNVLVHEFDYDPNRRPAQSRSDSAYEAYDDELIKTQWAGVIPSENILLIEDPKAIVDVMLGALALVSGKSDLDGFLVDMEGRGQSRPRLTQTAKALEQLAGSSALTKVDMGNRLPAKDSGAKRGGGSKRL